MLNGGGEDPTSDWRPPPPLSSAGRPAPPLGFEVEGRAVAPAGHPSPATRCRTCGGAISLGQAYCSSCGHPPLLGSNFCASCGRPTNPYTNPCPDCGAELMPRAPAGPSAATVPVGAPVAYVAAYPVAYPPGYGPPPKSRVAAVLLCLLCPAGAHRLYLGYTGQAIAQFALVFFGSLLSAALIGIPFVLAGFLWIFIDLIMILSGSLLDSDARPLA